MLYRITTLLLIFTGTVLAQAPETAEYDSYPENYSYDLVADRLNCIEGGVPLTFNTKVYGFIDYFIVRNREYTKDVIAKQGLYFPIMEEYLAKYDLPDELKYLLLLNLA